MQSETIRGYDIGEQIGRGGMADVYEAHQHGLERPVAIKFMKAALAEDREFVERFLREARICAKLNHPNIVQVYHVDTDSHERPYLVMELLRGQSLRQKLANGPMSEAEALAVTSQVLSSLVLAEKHGVVHRDIKPGNIFLCDGGVVKVMDFGIARAASEMSLTQTGAQMGTPEYMSPEQVNGVVDARSDLYSLGIVLYEMLTGEVPFDDPEPMAILQKQVYDPAPELPAKFSPPLRTVVRRALTKEPGARYQSAEAMLIALKSLPKPVPQRNPSGYPQARPQNPSPRMPPQPEKPKAAQAEKPTAPEPTPAPVSGSSPSALHLSAPAVLVVFLVIVLLVVAVGVGGYYMGRQSVVPGVAASSR